MKNFIVYVVIIEEYFYIGCTSNFTKRKITHKSLLKNNNHFNTKLQEIYNASEYKVVDINIVQEVNSLEEAYELEQYLIASALEKMSHCVNKNLNYNTWIACQDTESRKANIAQGMNRYYETLTEEERKDKYGRKGETNGMFGKTHTEEAKTVFRENIKKAQEANKGRAFSQEHKDKLSDCASLRTGELNSFYGKRHTEESKAKMAEANKGKIPVNARKVLADGITFNSVTECARYFSITYNAAAFRIKSPNFDYHYINA